MQISIKSCGLILALSLLGGAAMAAQLPGDTQETVTVPGVRSPADKLKADLDPTKTRFTSLTGEMISRDIRPEDRSVAFEELANSLSGPLDQTYAWHGPHDDGVFIPTREYEEAGFLCRDFWEQTARRGTEGLDPLDKFDDRAGVTPGSACHESDGWHFR